MRLVRLAIGELVGEPGAGPGGQHRLDALRADGSGPDRPGLRISEPGGRRADGEALQALGVMDPQPQSDGSADGHPGVVDARDSKPIE